MNDRKRAWAGIAVVGLVTASCAAMMDGGPAPDPAAKAIEVMKASFKPSGAAGQPGLRTVQVGHLFAPVIDHGVDQIATVRAARRHSSSRLVT